MKYIKFISVSLITLTIEIVILKVINDAVVLIELHLIVQFIAVTLYVIAFIVLNKVIIDMMIVEWFNKPKYYEDLDLFVNGDVLNDEDGDTYISPSDDVFNNDIINHDKAADTAFRNWLKNDWNKW